MVTKPKAIFFSDDIFHIFHNFQRREFAYFLFTRSLVPKGCVTTLDFEAGLYFGTQAALTNN